MSLGKRKSGNDFLPPLKYDARVGQMVLQDRVFVDGRWEPEQRVIATDKFRAVFDLENLQRGWIKFPKGAAPETVLVPAGVDPGDPPSDDHKEGLRIVVKMDDALGGDVRELMSTAVALWNATDDLHDKYLTGVADHPGELPVVTLTGTREMKTQSGTSFVPIFAIADWVPRPAELPATGIPTGQPMKASTAAKPAAPSRPVAFFRAGRGLRSQLAPPAATTRPPIPARSSAGGVKSPSTTSASPPARLPASSSSTSTALTPKPSCAGSKRNMAHCPPASKSITARGRHIFLLYPDPPARVRNSAKKIAPDIDVRGDGGYVVAPPSIHPSGNAYCWSVDSARTFAAAPDWLLTLIAEPANGAAAVTPPSEWRELVKGVAEGARDCSAAKLAGYLLRRRIDPFVTLELLRGWNATRCAPPLPERDIERIVDSIATRELRRRGIV